MISVKQINGIIENDQCIYSMLLSRLKIRSIKNNTGKQPIKCLIEMENSELPITRVPNEWFWYFFFFFNLSSITRYVNM